MDIRDAAAMAPLEHTRAMALQEAELERTLDALAGLAPEAWTTRVPDCPDWDVRQMYLHVLGAFAAAASPVEQVRQLRRAKKRQKRHGGPLEANLSAVQVADRESMDPAAVLDALRTVGPKGIRRRRKLVGWLRRHVKMKVDGPVEETWTLGYLVDTIYLRDLWMHRIDLGRALGSDPVLTADHDGAIVADVVGEWARRHGQPFRLSLAGLAGGEFCVGAGAGPALELDGVEFCRTLAGRVPSDGLLATVVPF